MVLDDLYLGILRRCCGTISPDDFKYIVGSIVFAKSPLSQRGLDSFLGLGDHLIGQPMVLPNGSEVELASSTSILNSFTSLYMLERQYKSSTHLFLISSLPPIVATIIASISIARIKAVSSQIAAFES